MSEPPLGEGPGPTPEGVPQPPADPGSPDYAGAPGDAPRRGGAHRATGRPTPPPPPPAGAPYWTAPELQPDEPVAPSRADAMSSRLLLGGVALIALIGLLAVLYWLFAPKTTTEDTAAGNKTTGTTTSQAGAGGGKPTGASSSPTSASSKPTATTSAKPTTKGTATAKPTSKPAPTSKATPAAKPTTKPAAAPTTKATTKPPDVKVPLVVLNNSRIHGLAVTGANDFRGGGWTVLSTGNYHGRLPESTVYYSPGNKAAAETLARQFPSITAVEPKPAGLTGGGPLTVVLTRNFKP